jgi:hypothetical protein
MGSEASTKNSHGLAVSSNLAVFYITYKNLNVLQEGNRIHQWLSTNPLPVDNKVPSRKLVYQHKICFYLTAFHSILKMFLIINVLKKYSFKENI